MNNIQTETLLVDETEITATKEKNLVLYNDEVNTFDFVIESLVKICKHDIIQAEQCTYMVHYNGRCAVKTGASEKLNPLCIALLERGLTAQIE